MRLYWNELTLSEPHVSLAVAAQAIDGFLEARNTRPVLARSVYCARSLPDTVLGDGQPLRAVVRSLKPDVRMAFFRWVSSLGPFLEDEREPFDDDLFLFGQEDVTEKGLGEAARQRLRERAAGVFSPAANPDGNFAGASLQVSHGFPDEPMATVDIPNFLDLAAAADSLSRAVPEPRRWAELLTQCRDYFPALAIGSHCDAILGRFPFERNVARRAIELLRVLQRMVEETDKATGAISEAGRELLQRHFVGEKAWFSDAGGDEKKDFKSEMTFPNPDGEGMLTMFWHGKVKTPQYRIHFEWPIPAPYTRLRVGYIGPKISKG